MGKPVVNWRAFPRSVSRWRPKPSVSCKAPWAKWEVFFRPFARKWLSRVTSSVGFSSPGSVGWDPGGCITSLYLRWGCSWRFPSWRIHSTFINILISAWSRGTRQAFPQDTSVLLSFEFGKWSGGWGSESQRLVSEHGKWGVWMAKSRTPQPSPTRGSFLHSLSVETAHFLTLLRLWHLVQTALESDKFFLSTYLISPTSWMEKDARSGIMSHSLILSYELPPQLPLCQHSVQWLEHRDGCSIKIR